MRQKPGTKQSHGEKVVKDVRRATRKQYSAEEKIRIVLDGIGACLGLVRAGLRPGADVSVFGFDEIQDAAVATPALTTMAVSLHKLGRKLARTLLDRIEDPEMPPVVRRQGLWDRWPPELREDLAHLFGLIMRRIYGEASAGFRWYFI